MEGRGEWEGEERRRQGPMAGHCSPATIVVETCATPDLFLKHPHATFATYS
jgi:hypothetical protein